MKKSRLLVAVCACVFSLLSISAHAIGVSGQGTWETTLQGRDLDGNLSTAEAYYDTVLDITWLADTNYTNTPMNWAEANTWVASLNPYSNSITGWRLPNVSPIDGTTADDAILAYNGSEDRGWNVSAPGTLYAGSTASEMAHMFYNTLGNLGNCEVTSVFPNCVVQIGWGLNNTGPFSNLQSVYYWSDTEYPPLSSAWRFGFDRGDQDLNGITTNSYAWAVHDGDVGAAVVPAPASLWLFGSGLLGLIGVARRRAS